ncbi:site-specific DNA-methyltransferase [Roseitalea porphyridii]|uniref:site-specific DNA-methyltransferase (adenine-specific) n=1 Tax=Roseitalea porphyridii TaxID=1852022 RepID=A0A4P6UYD5_9HYPH|nr:site-specific DNA-methyltransferase [Roseitalea porphyridii]QBK30137.1 site-specific DNA-methyltransferase [Roseitalea porphyridii]
MAKKPSKPQDVENYKHDAAKRTMIPTAEQQGFVEEDEARPIKLRYPRNTDLDPQLVWRGRDAEDATDLYVDAPPVYIQEKIHPRAIIERLKRETAARREASADMPDLFADFNGRPDDLEARTEFYAHEQNWQNRMILGDALMVMANLAERENLRGKVQCIYMDPPYGISFNSNWQATTGSRNMDDKAAYVSREPEVIRAFRDTWKDGIHSYLSYLRDRLTVARDLLTESGSIFVQIGDENVHRVRALMDEVFGEKNRVALLLVKKKGGQKAGFIEEINDYIVWFFKDRGKAKFNALFEAPSDESEIAEDFKNVRLLDGSFTTIAALAKQDAVGSLYAIRPSEVTRAHPSSELFTSENIVAGGVRINQSHLFPYQGRLFDPGLAKGNCWKHTAHPDQGTKSGMSRLARSDRLYVGDKQIRYIRKFSDFGMQAVSNWWSGFGGASDRRYVVQTNERVVERCILMSTDPGDLVLDPSCGSGTTAYVAEQWGRRWITMDTSRVALALARARLMDACYPFYHLKDSEAGLEKEAEITGLAAHADRLAEVRRAGHRPDLSLGFVYRRIPRITSAVMANNAEIDDLWDDYHPAVETALASLNDSLKGHGTPFPVTTGGRADKAIDFTAAGDVEMPSGELAPANGFMEWEVPRDAPESWPIAAKTALEAFWNARIARQQAIDASIEREGNRNAEFLYDQPYEDRKVVRVAGPFTVESLSPYRVIPSEDDLGILDMLRDEEGDLPPRMLPKEQTDFAEVVMEHLKTAGVQNTKKGERLEFGCIEPWPGKGYVAFEGRYEERGATRRAAIAIGPEYDAVGYEFVRNAAREARDAFDILIICGFQFAPEVDDSMLNFGRLKVLKARMNQDIRMGDKLKNTGAGNLFVVFGEPDIDVREAGEGQIEVEIKGVDIFDPTTGEVNSSNDPAEDIACWFIDDDYDQESFFVRQAYFLGGASGDPYKALKRALKAEIDEEAWATLHTTVSAPFPRPDGGLICVKVINHFGDEVQKVFST